MADSSFGGLKDFSVDAQRRMFIEQQERERQVAENKKASRKAKQAMGLGGSDREGAPPSGVALSGLMSGLEGGGNGANDGNNGNRPRRQVAVGDDDDDSIADDDWSLDSEESFYVGIERADYAQPDNLEMYGEEKEDENKNNNNLDAREDRFGISRVSVAIVNREGGGNDGKAPSLLDWDADIPIHAEGSSSLHEFMNGTTASNSRGGGAATPNNNFVARPIVGSTLEWKEEGKLGDGDDAAVDQVYEHKAAEGKAFIDKIVKEGGGDGGGEGTYPVLSPMAMFSPGLASSAGNGGGAPAEGEDNGVRQMRERELRKEAAEDANRRMKDLKRMIATKKDKGGKVDAYEMMKMLDKLMSD